MKRLVKISLQETFPNEIKLLSVGISLSSKHILRGLSPFIDAEGLLRVGGRLTNAKVTHDVKHTLLLCGNHRLTKLICEHERTRLQHAGPQMLLFSIRQNYWPTSGKNVAKAVVRQCIISFKYKPKVITPIMADLPKERVTAVSSFFATGVDYAGPFLPTDKRGSGCKLIKGYICLLICLSSNAIHLELVTDLTSNAFILALRRFSARRGKPSQVFSDNRTNFTGAHKELKFQINLLKQFNCEIVRFCTDENISWRFIPANSPYFDGLWESGVKSIKRNLLRVLGNTPVTYEEFNTILIQIKATLNSRSLCPLSSDLNDIQTLTPAHFLIGKSLTRLPYPNVQHIAMNRLYRYQLLQQVVQNFWSRWAKEYLNYLQQRNKWTNNSGQLKIGALVLIKQDNMHPCNWLLGRVIELHKGNDNVVRVVSVKTKNGILKRAAVKLCPLPEPAKINDDDGSDIIKDSN